jgi:hypothetical protein
LARHSARLRVTAASWFLSPLTEAFRARYFSFQVLRLFLKNQIRAPGRLL